MSGPNAEWNTPWKQCYVTEFCVFFAQAQGIDKQPLVKAPKDREQNSYDTEIPEHALQNVASGLLCNV